MDAGFQPNRICNSCGRRSRHQPRSPFVPNGLEEKGFGLFFLFIFPFKWKILNAGDSAVKITAGKGVNMNQQRKLPIGAETSVWEIFTLCLPVIRILRHSPNKH